MKSIQTKMCKYPLHVALLPSNLLPYPNYHVANQKPCLLFRFQVTDLIIMVTISCSLGRIWVGLIQYSYHFVVLQWYIRLVWYRKNTKYKIQTMARQNSPDMPPKRTKKVRLGINNIMVWWPISFCTHNVSVVQWNPALQPLYSGPSKTRVSHLSLQPPR